MHDIDTYYNQITKVCEYLKPYIHAEIKFGFILGTGLSGIKDEINIDHTIPYRDIPFFPQSTVQSHEGQIILGRWEGVPVLVLSGRFHCYEGYTAKEVTFPIRVLQLLGIKNLWISNVTGGLNEDYSAGDVVLVTDHINMMPDHPLTGPNDDRLGIRFPDMKNAYHPGFIQLFEASAKELSIPYHKGVYLSLQGPSLETPAEYNMIHILGADLVGMSTVPEVIVAKHAEMNVMVCSIVSNQCYPIDQITETTVDEVIAVAQKGGQLLKTIWSYMIKRM